MIDLHGLFVNEVREFLPTLWPVCARQGVKEVCVITGQGGKGGGRLRGEVSRQCERGGRKHGWDEAGGMVWVRVGR